MCLLHKQHQGLQIFVVIYHLALPRWMIVAIEQISWNQLHLLKLLYASYIFLWRQAEKAGVFYSADKCFETRADPSIIFDKQILKFGRHVCRHLLRDHARDFGVEFESLRQREIFEISARAQKTIGSHLKRLSSSTLCSFFFIILRCDSNFWNVFLRGLMFDLILLLSAEKVCGSIRWETLGMRLPLLGR